MAPPRANTVWIDFTSFEGSMVAPATMDLAKQLAPEDDAARAIREVLGPEAALSDLFEIKDVQQLRQLCHIASQVTDTVTRPTSSLPPLPCRAPCPRWGGPGGDHATGAEPTIRPTASGTVTPTASGRAGVP